VAGNPLNEGQGERVKLTIGQLRARQLRLLRAVADHCETHGLRYYLCAGTLLGAVRHGGYIPWDDDIDLMLPRPDFDALCASFPTSAAPDQVSLRALSNSPTHVLPFAKVCDDQTRLEVESDIIKGLGVFIDVFPLDGWSDRQALRIVQRVSLRLLPQVMRIMHVVRKRRRTMLRNLLIAVGKVVLSGLRPRWVAMTMEKVARLGNFDSCSYGGVIVWGYQESMPVKAYGTPGELIFEDRSYNVPQDCDTVLQSLYGDYMLLPPEEARVTNHRFVAYER